MDIARQIAAVLFVFGLLGGLLFLGRRGQWFTAGLRRSMGDSRRLELIETMRIGPHHAIHIIRVDRRTVVISAHPAGCTLLRDLEGPGTDT